MSYWCYRASTWKTFADQYWMVYEHWAIVLKWHFLDLLALLFAMIYFHRFHSVVDFGVLWMDKEGTFVTRHLLGTSASLIELSAMPRVSAIESLQFTRRCSFIAVSPSITELICNLCSCVVPVVFIDVQLHILQYAYRFQRFRHKSSVTVYPPCTKTQLSI